METTKRGTASGDGKETSLDFSGVSIYVYNLSCFREDASVFAFLLVHAIGAVFVYQAIT